MKKILNVLFAILLLTVLLAPGASGLAKQPIHVGLVLSTDDGSDPHTYDGMAVQGLHQAENKFKVVGHVYPYTLPYPDETAYLANLHDCASQGYDLCLAVGFLMAAATWQAALDYPDTEFAILDNMYFEDYPLNLQSVWMKRAEEGYLAGFLAGLMTESDVVGVVGGMDLPVIRDLAFGYRYGAQCANPQAEVLINYTGTFSDPALGAQVAQEMIDQGADVIFNAAGPTGTGAILHAAGQGKYAIGVDTDEYYTSFGGGSVPGAQYLLSSAMNKIDVTLFHIIEQYLKRNFTPGLKLVGLAEGETGMAPYHESQPFVSKEVQKQLTKLEKDIIQGKVYVDESCRALIGFVTVDEDLQGNYWNSSPIAGLERAEADFGVDGTIFVTQGFDYDTTLTSCINQGNSLCISSNFWAYEPTRQAAWGNPAVDFVIVDYTPEEGDPDNLRGLSFAHAQAGYLAGTLGGLMSASEVIGSIGGIPIPAVVDFLDGYRYGAGCANSGVVVLEEYAGTFTDPDLGAAIAQNMLDQGADVIFTAAGPTGTGGLMQATSQGAWGIGVDSDEYLTTFQDGNVPGAEYILSSAMKHLDVAVYDTIEKYLFGGYSAGEAHYDLAAGGVGLAPYHAADPFVSQAVRDYLALVEAGIIDGTIDVKQACP